MEWVFDGGRPCLDLVNTFRDRALAGRELLAGPAALREWLGLAGFEAPPVTAAQLAQARELREGVDRVLRAVAAGDRPRAADVRLLNETASASPPPVARLRVAADGTPRRHVPRPADPVAAAFSALAADAIDLATSGVAVRVCAAEDCGIRFADSSPQRNRQWCSMGRCGNRAKARAHYRRSRRS
jgi:predicted RNA-binding Zn ribbon-like protein